MTRHLTANLWLLVLTLVICAILYPLALWGIGQTVFHEKANGSLLTDKDGKAVGSRLIAQPFAGDEYFQPRPSAVSYNAAATGGTNWGANNPALRKRVVGMLGSLLKYRDGRLVGPDIVVWAQENLNKDRAILSQWIEADGNLAERWGAANAEFLKGWEKEHENATAKWRSENSGVADVPPAVLAGLFFESYLEDPSVAWPETDGKDIQAAFFELWWKAHPRVELEPVPSDLVMASGGGLDPHITLKAALYQLDRIAAKWAATTSRDQVEVRKQIEALLREKAEAPLHGLVGVQLVNVLEVDIALRDLYGS